MAPLVALVGAAAGAHIVRDHPEPRGLVERLRYLALCQHCVVQNGIQRTGSMGWCLRISGSDVPVVNAALVSELEIGEYHGRDGY